MKTILIAILLYSLSIQDTSYLSSQPIQNKNITNNNPSQISIQKKSAKQRIAERRAQTTRHRTVESPSMNKQELKKHLEDYQVKLIMENNPPLPIPLTYNIVMKLQQHGIQITQVHN